MPEFVKNLIKISNKYSYNDFEDRSVNNEWMTSVTCEFQCTKTSKKTQNILPQNRGVIQKRYAEILPPKI